MYGITCLIRDVGKAPLLMPGRLILTEAEALRGIEVFRDLGLKVYSASAEVETFERAVNIHFHDGNVHEYFITREADDADD